MKTYAFIPARKIQNSVIDKSNYILDGEMLFVKAIKTLLNCKEIDKIILDTNSEELYKQVDYLPIDLLLRSEELAQDGISSNDLLINEINNFQDADIYLQIMPTFPFIDSNTIDKALNDFKNNSEFDSLLFMKKEKLFKWENNKPNYELNITKNFLADTISETTSITIVRKESFVKNKNRIGENPMLYYPSILETIECNTVEQLEFAKLIANGIKQKEIVRYNLIKHFATSALISDIIDDLEVKYNRKIGGILNGFICNLDNVKLLGNASTLKIRTLRGNEDYNGIYLALKSYDFVGQNDIIVVENEEANFAYFGDLNARLAIRAGASGTIVNGATRDKDATKSLSYPVFAKKYNSKDVRRRATLDYINKPINIDGVIINPGDLIFIDNCSMAVINQEYKKEVLEKVLEVYCTENNVIKDIALNKEVSKIIKNNGAF